MSRQDLVWPQPSWIFPVLDDLGLAFARRFTDRGVQYAGLRIATGTDQAALSVLADRGTLRLTAHNVGPAQRFDAVAILNRRLPLARPYVTGRQLELAVGVFLGDAELGPDDLGRLIEHLVLSQANTRGLAAAPQRPAISRPPHPGPVAIPMVGEGRRDALSASLTADGWIDVVGGSRQALQIVEPPSWATLDRLQLWTTAGKFVTDEAGNLTAHVQTPALGGDLEARLHWSVDQAEYMLEVAARHLQ